MMGKGEALLEIRDLRTEFPEGTRSRRGRKVQALRGVSLAVLEGESFGIVGESGSGKTTLARTILRLLRPTRGTVKYRGMDVHTLTAKDLLAFRKKVQIVFQDPFGSLNPRIRAGRMLDEVLQVHRPDLSRAARGERTDELLSLVGLRPEAALRYPHEFSGGQRQRLGIARALSVEPELLILDEPVSALDLSVQAQILNLLVELKASLGLTYLLITHDLSVLRQVTDRVGVFYLGEVVEIGPTEALFDDPVHPYTKGLLAAAEPLEKTEGDVGEWTVLPGEPPSAIDPPTGCAFHPRCPHPSKGPACAAEAPSLQPANRPRKVACLKAWEHLTGP